MNAGDYAGATATARAIPGNYAQSSAGGFRSLAKSRLEAGGSPAFFSWIALLNDPADAARAASAGSFSKAIQEKKAGLPPASSRDLASERNPPALDCA